MFLGHFAMGFAAKRAAPKASLGVLMAAPLLLDLLWPIAILTGIETVRIEPGNTPVTPLDFNNYPYTHSLAMALVWSLLFAGGYLLLRRDRRAAWVVGLGVFSHWALDLVVHRPDLPLFPGSQTYLGLGLWYSFAGTLVAEGSLFVLGAWLYVSGTRSRNRTGSLALWALLAFLAVLYVAVLFGPPPPSTKAIGLAGLASWLFIPWAWWIDRNRSLVTREPSRAS